MKKFFAALALTAGIFTSNSLFAQVYEQGGNIVHAGIGFGSPYANYTTTGGSISSLPPVHISFEHGLKDKIGIGGLIGYSSTTIDYSSFNYKFKYSQLVIGVRGAYHFINEDKYDVYAGLMLGYNIGSASYEGSGTVIQPVAVSGVAFAGFAGARYKWMMKEKGADFQYLFYCQIKRNSKFDLNLALL